jgi:integral membrane protein
VSPRQLFRAVAVAEAITWTLLLAGLILKYGFGVDIAVTIGGTLHGIVFIAYAFTALLVALNQRWPLPVALVAVAVAVVPYGTIPTEIVLDRRGRLDGDWHRQPTDDPRDQQWIYQLLRWLLNHVAIFIVVAFALVAIVVTVLLVAGPPGGK